MDSTPTTKDAVAPLRLRTLGELHLLAVDGAPQYSGRRELVLLAYLALKREPVPRGELATLLWGHRPQARARQSLRQALLDLKRIAGSCVVATVETVALEPHALELDVDMLDADLAAGRIDRALERYRGDFLESADDWADETLLAWARNVRIGLRRRVTHAVETAVMGARAAESWDEAMRYAEAAANRLRHDESPHRLLIETLVEAGRTNSALAVHQAFVARLASDLDLTPSAAFLTLIDSLPSKGTLNTTPPRTVVAQTADDALRAAWARVRSGKGSSLFICGAGATGPDSVVHRFAQHAAAFADYLLLASPGDTKAGSLLANLRTAPGLSGAPSEALAELAELVPTIRERFPRLPAARGEEQNVTAAVARVLSDVAAETPVFLLIDDVAQADAVVQMLAARLSEALHHAAVLIVITARSTEETPFVRALSAVQPQTVVLPAATDDGNGKVAHLLLANVKRRGLVGVMAILLAIALLLPPIAARRSVDASRAQPRMAILPFEVRSGQDLNYLREGMVDLMSAGLDGVTGLQLVDARAVVMAATREAGSSSDPDRAQHVAQMFDADQYVLGSITGVGDRIQLNASLYDDSGELMRSVASTAPTEAELPSAVDELIRLMLARPPARPEEQVRTLAATTTSSLPALRAFLIGEAHYRKSEYEAALRAYQKAIAADSIFALAHFRAALAAGWNPGDGTVAGRASIRAGELAERLGGTDRKLLTAFHADRAGEFTRPAALFREILDAEPTNLEAWNAYGELLFHRGPSMGHGTAATRKAFERVLALDPHDESARVHLARIAALERDTRTLQRLHRESANDAIVHRREVDALYAFGTGDGVAQGHILRELRSAAPQDVWNIAWLTMSHTRSPKTGAAIIGLLLAPGVERRWQVAGHAALAHFAAARGQLDEMERHVAAFEREDRFWALETRAALVAQPLLQMTRARAMQLYREMAKTDRVPHIELRAPAIYQFATIVQEPDYPWRLVTGMLALRAGGFDAVQKEIAFLANPADVEPRLSRAGAFGHDLAAWQALARNDAQTAAHKLAEGRIRNGIEIAVPFPASLIYSNSARRFLSGDALMALGKPAEALRWYMAIPDALGYEAIHIAPAEFRLGQAYERLGKKKQAAEHYRRFIDLWRDCDPELRSYVRYAKSRL